MVEKLDERVLQFALRLETIDRILSGWAHGKYREGVSLEMLNLKLTKARELSEEIINQ
ncbi:hypothetical protein PHIM7_331 [Sinorhizobium phage phiM7]|uniref:Uncharacterized protein n=3 Tax=Emdodecavirus TaxID=1980937 RepID=S5MVX6_9CAUD|nr:hypothetical protein AB690_gp183 [Sinorhizobium phage phiM12]YP_009212576.1 hypothetical protein AVT40_gp197 [Sinorhizobium phage phiN3]YP_009601456.1 hypothetical protein FDH46_gp147 [Sinorhizobium phage phiM7]AKF13236.1 hypothetical protein PHIM19_331 [Sinorhizobium phage phiM19]AGR48057.2 hypothetical protein SmphiM12_425 [Sinorhizobium phage phiM12]AKF12876.1 hypothetical protein PHIM7_331 [Sinorhizobium phage phiM7]AKF13599.1 hypothetical protein PHIN3_336 [Sinorhizobium phage phiN3]